MNLVVQCAVAAIRIQDLLVTDWIMQPSARTRLVPRKLGNV